MEKLRESDRYTYADYAAWTGDTRYELIDGEAYMMSPAPGRFHQKLCTRLISEIDQYLKGKTCEVYAAPFDVRLNADAEDDTVVQPDITVVCDPGKLDDRGCRGVPDMVVEVISPSSVRHDQLTKFNKYREAGVREYWIVSPDARSVQIFLLEDGKYVGYAYGDTDKIPVSVLDGLAIDMAEVFPPEES